MGTKKDRSIHDGAYYYASGTYATQTDGSSAYLRDLEFGIPSTYLTLNEKVGYHNNKIYNKHNITHNVYLLILYYTFSLHTRSRHSARRLALASARGP